MRRRRSHFGKKTQVFCLKKKKKTKESPLSFVQSSPMVLKKNPLLFHEAVQIVDPCWQVARSDMNACLTSRKTPKPSRGSGAARQTLCTASAAQLCAPVAVDPERELVRKSERGPSEAHTPRGSIGKWGGWWTSRQQVLWHPIPSSDLVASGVLFPPRCWAKGVKRLEKELQ